MLKIYFDEVLIDEDSYTALTNDYKLFTDSFKLGSVACNSFKLSINKAMVENHPNEVKIEDDNTTFYLIVDSFTEDRYVYNYTLVDKLINFNFNYDASLIINEKAELEETCYLSDIWHDMCNQAGVEYDETYTFLNDIEVNWYDNRIQARKYLSYIAELQGGYACILENGKQSFKPFKKTSNKTINIDECSDFILGEKKTITRVVYDTGTIFWTFGDNTGTTLYLDTTNVFITSEEVVENIYDSIVNFEFFMVNVPNAPMDSSIKAGDIITLTDGINNYPTIAQYSMSYGGGWIGSYKIQVNTDKQEETKIVGTKEIVKKIESEIDRINGTLTITSEKTDTNASNIASLQITSDGLIENISKITDLEERTTVVETAVDGINVKIEKIGGSNLIINSARHYTNQWGDNIFPGYTDTDIKQNTVSKNCFFVGNGTNSQEIQVQNGTYTISWKYKKLLSLANVKLKINGVEKTLNELNWKVGSYTFEVLSNTILIEIIGDTENCCYLSDLMCCFGSIPQVWSSAQGESVYGKTKMGEMFEAESDIENKRTTLGADGLRGYNTITNELVFETTTKGSKGKHLEFESSKIGRILRTKVGNQTWDTYVG